MGLLPQIACSGKSEELAAGHRRSVRVVLFVLYGDGPSGLPKAGHVATPIQLDNVVKFRRLTSESDADIIELALDESDYEELWNRFITGGGFSNFFQDMALRQELLQMTSGHASM